MKKGGLFTSFCLILITYFLSTAFLLAADSKTNTPKKTGDRCDIFQSASPSKTNGDEDLSKNSSSSLYTLETDETMASDSLNRISGNLDLGFSPPENTFRSPNHYGAGPVAKERAEEGKTGKNSY